MRFAVVLPVLAVLSCGETPPPPAEPRAHLRVDPPQLAFGRVALPQTRVLSVRNLGDVGSELVLEPPVLDTQDFTVEVRGENELAVTAAPSSPGWKTAELVLASSAGTVRVPLTAEALAKTTCDVVAPMQVDFGGLGSLTRHVVDITTAGAGYCVLSNVALEPGSDEAFSVPEGQLPLVLVPGQWSPLTVAAQPRWVESSQALRGALRVGNRRIELTASLFLGCEIILPSTDLNFGTVRTSCPAAPRTITVHNLCEGPVQLSALRMLGSTEFKLLHTNLPLTASVGGVPGVITVQYAPSGDGPHTGAVAFKFGQLDYVVTLRGTGDDFGSSTDTFSNDLPLRSTFFLTAQPVPNSLRVTVDGVPASGWVFDGASNAIRFAQAPRQGSIIAVRYDLPCP